MAVYYVHSEYDGVLEEFTDYDKAVSFCNKYLRDSLIDDYSDIVLANGGLRILKIVATSEVVEKRYRKDYFENEESMTEEEYEEACDEYDCADPDCEECWILGMKAWEEDV